LEVVFQVPKDNVGKAVPIIKELMEDPFDGKIPLNLKMEVDWNKGKNYKEAK